MMTFLLAVGAVLMIMKHDATPQKHERQSFFHEMSEAFRYLLSKKGVFTLVLLMSVVCFYIGLLQSSLVLAGLFYALMGVFTSVWLIMVFGFLFFITLPFVNTSLEVLIRTNVENERQGRGIGFLFVLSGLLVALLGIVIGRVSKIRDLEEMTLKGIHSHK
jgi:MFS transporter, DHA3 family, macrolide efflux protein